MRKSTSLWTTSTSTETGNAMNRLRRSLLKLGSATAVAGTALVCGLLAPLRALAGLWPAAAFDAKTIDEALQAAGVVDPLTSQDIAIKAPEIAENGAQVPVEIASHIPGTRSIYIFVDKNPQPFTGSFEFREDAERFVSTRIKMGESSTLRAVAFAEGKYYMAAREVKVTIGGCGE